MSSGSIEQVTEYILDPWAVKSGRWRHPAGHIVDHSAATPEAYRALCRSLLEKGSLPIDSFPFDTVDMRPGVDDCDDIFSRENRASSTPYCSVVTRMRIVIDGAEVSGDVDPDAVPETADQQIFE